MKQADECETRKRIDEAAAAALGIDESVLADWRRRLAAEPTITNARAAQQGVNGKMDQASLEIG